MTAAVERLLDALECQARARARDLAAAGRIGDEILGLYEPSPGEVRETQRLLAALLLATSVDSFLALARGRSAPADLLDVGLLSGGWA